jgi:hypothetical protein
MSLTRRDLVENLGIAIASLVMTRQFDPDERGWTHLVDCQ